MDPVAVDVERNLWDSAFALVSAIVGSSAGVLSLFRLPLMLQTFHPGSFLVALFFSMLLLALPMSIVELSLGQMMRLAAIPVIDTVVRGGRGLAFASVLIGSLLCTAYCSTAIAHLVAPIFSDSMNSPSTASMLRSSFDLSAFGLVVDDDEISDSNSSSINSSINSSAANSSRAVSLPPLSSAMMSIGSWWSVLALFFLWLFAAVLSYKLGQFASVFAKVVLPLLLSFTGIFCIYCAAHAQDDADGTWGTPLLFRFLLLPTSEFLNSGRLWANAAAQALLLLQVGCGFTLTAGSRSKPVHSTVNVAIALFATALLLAFFFTIGSAGTMSIVGANMVPPATRSSSTSSGNGTGKSALLPNSTSTAMDIMNITSHHFAFVANLTGRVLYRQHEVELLPLESLPVLFSAVFARDDWEGGDGGGAKAFGVFFLVALIIAGTLSVTLILRSFFGDVSDLHVGLRHPLTVFGAAAACFAISAPMAHVSADSAVVMMALDQAVVGTTLPMLLCAESIVVAFAGWGGASVLRQLKGINAEDLSCGGKLIASAMAIISFGNLRIRNQLLGGGGSGGSSSSSKNRNLDTVHGKLVAWVMPFFLKLVVPVLCLMVALTNLITFAQARDATAFSKVVYAVVVFCTGASIYVVAHAHMFAAGGVGNPEGAAWDGKHPHDRAGSGSGGDSGAAVEFPHNDEFPGAAAGDRGGSAAFSPSSSSLHEQQEQQSHHHHHHHHHHEKSRKKPLPWQPGLNVGGASTMSSGVFSADDIVAASLQHQESSRGCDAAAAAAAAANANFTPQANDATELVPPAAKQEAAGPQQQEQQLAALRGEPSEILFSPVAGESNNASRSSFRASTITWKEDEEHQ